ncbi:MAG: Acireductone dioxygenase, partial [Pseudomonadota bacterium]
MSALTIYPDDQPQSGEQYTDFTAIQKQLANIGVQFERWTSGYELATDADQATVLNAYADSIERL